MMNGRIGVVAMIEDGTTHEVLLSEPEKGQVMALLMQMFRGKPLPVSGTELPVESVGVNANDELRKRMRGGT